MAANILKQKQHAHKIVNVDAVKEKNVIVLKTASAQNMQQKIVIAIKNKAKL